MSESPEVQPEQVLTGGNATPVSRIGDAVHRAAGPWSPTIQRLLAHWRAAGCDFVPAPLGFDEQGRERVEFAPGEVPNYPMPDFVWSAQTLHTAARWLRQLHDASLDFDRAGARWRAPSHQPDEVICLNDVAPYNFVFTGRTLVAMIDFDQASPGPRVWDLAYLAYRICPFGEEAGPGLPGTLDDRLDDLLDHYGRDLAPSAAQVIAMLSPRMLEMARAADQHAVSGALPELHDHAAMYRREAVRLAALAPRPQ